MRYSKKIILSFLLLAIFTSMGIFLFWYYHTSNTVIIPPPILSKHDPNYPTKIVHLLKEYELGLGEKLPLEYSPYLLELVEIDHDNKLCKLKLFNTVTNEYDVFWAANDQPLKEIERITGQRGYMLLGMTEKTVKIYIRRRKMP